MNCARARILWQLSLLATTVFSSSIMLFAEPSGRTPQYTHYPDELREHLLSRYHSERIRRILDEAFAQIKLESQATPGDRREASNVLLDFANEEITTWLLIEARDGSRLHHGQALDLLQNERGVSNREVLPIARAMLLLVWTDDEVRPVASDIDDPGGFLESAASLLSEAIGVSHRRPDRHDDGYYHRTALRGWVFDALERGIRNDEISETKRAGLQRSLAVLRSTRE